MALHGKTYPRATGARRDYLMVVSLRRNLGQVHGSRGLPNCQGSYRTSTISTMIDYSLSMALAECHDKSKILAHNIMAVKP